MLYIGIDVGGTTIKAGVVDESGHILHKDHCVSHLGCGAEAMVDDMAALALRVLAESGHTLTEIASVGLGIPGMLIGVPLTATVYKWIRMDVNAKLQAEATQASIK